MRSVQRGRAGAGASRCRQPAGRALRAWLVLTVFLLSGISGISISTAPKGPCGPQLPGAAATSRGMLPKSSWMSDSGGQAGFEGE